MPQVAPQDEQQRLHRTELQVHREETALRLLVVGWMLMFFNVLVLLFVPSDFRGGHYGVALIVVGLGAISIALILAGLVTRKSVEKEVAKSS